MYAACVSGCWRLWLPLQLVLFKGNAAVCYMLKIFTTLGASCTARWVQITTVSLSPDQHGCAGPSSFRRVLAARQLAWWVSQLQYRALEACFGQLLPLMLACMDDPSAPVQCLGLCMVRHLAQGVLFHHFSSRWYSDLNPVP